MSVAIVTDSTADIPKELLNKYHIHVVPNILIIEGQSLVDGVDISRQEFYERLPTMKSPPTTGTASPGAYEKLYDKLFGDGASHIFSIHAASKLSGIFNAASTVSSTVVISQWGSASKFLLPQKALPAAWKSAGYSIWYKPLARECGL